MIMFRWGNHLKTSGMPETGSTIFTMTVSMSIPFWGMQDSLLVVTRPFMEVQPIPAGSFTMVHGTH